MRASPSLPAARGRIAWSAAIARVVALGVAVAATLAAALTGGCGGGGGSHRVSVAGLYAIDVDATFGVSPAPTPGESSVTGGVRARFDPAAHSLLLRGDQTFRMETSTGAGSIVVEGTWSSSAAGVQLTATAVDGAPPTAQEAAPDSLRLEGPTLVLDGPAGRRIVWRRVP